MGRPDGGGFSPDEIARLRKLAASADDLTAMAKERATIFGMYRAIRIFCIWFIGFSTLAIMFKQSVVELVNSIRGLFK
jgi:hypothetical protein